MNRNTESRFALNPSINIGRSKFKISSGVKTSFNVGDLIPFYFSEVLPGDTFNINTSKVVRMPSFLTAPMDNLYLDTYYFFVPMRLVWNHTKQFFGENSESAWIPETEYTIPQIESPSGGWEIGTIADYFGVPTGISDLSISALPFRAYALICDQWFRSENLTDPLNIPVDDSTITGVNTGNYITDTVKGGLPFKASKYFDYFTGCLPAPQKGPDVEIPVAQGQGSGLANVFGNGYALALNSGTVAGSMMVDSTGGIGLNANASGPVFLEVGETGSDNYGIDRNTGVGLMTKDSLGDNPEYSGLVADLSSAGLEVVAGSINQLRLAFQIQKYYERLARNGSRYNEYILGMFGVQSPDARLQRSEYLGGNRIPITINQIIQNSATGSGSTPQGTVTGQSLTSDVHYDFNRSFTEHGLVIGVMVARYDHTYQQGLERYWSRKEALDFYVPLLANIGEQAVLNKEIYAQGSSVVDEDTDKPYDDEVFGYQEAWADYRYKPSKITVMMRRSASASLDPWHFADDYSSMPFLSDEWLREDKLNIDRTLAVTSAVSNQLFADIWVTNKAVRPMPMYSIPGLIDHH